MSKKDSAEKGYSHDTRLVHGKSHSSEWDYSHHVVPPVTRSASFRLTTAGRGAQGFAEIGKRAFGDDSASIYVYGRMGEPNIDMLQDNLAAAELGEIGVAFSSGMAAVTAATLFSLSPGDEIVSHKTIYGCTYSLFTKWLPRFGYGVTFEDLAIPEKLLPHINERTRIVYLESPANPSLGLLDIPEIANLVAQLNAKRPPQRRILTVIDNTFATPFCQRPITMGIDIVVHSLTKGISGFGSVIGGAIVTRREYWEQLITFRKDFGSILGPEVAWQILVYGLSTLTLRMRQQQSIALEVANFLQQHPKVEFVRYPGLDSFPQKELARKLLKDYEGNFAPGTMIYFSLKGSPDESRDRGSALMDYVAKNSYTITLAVSLGQVRTLIEHPGSMTHAAYPAAEQVLAGIDPGGIRLSIGIENSADIIRDLDEALSSLA